MMIISTVDVKTIIIYSIYIFVVKGYINLNGTSDTGKCAGLSIDIACVVNPQVTEVRIFKPGGSSVASCTAPLGGLATACTPILPYRITVNKVGSTTTFVLSIPSLNRSIHNGVWKCTHGSDESIEARLSVRTTLTFPGKSPIITIFPPGGGLVSNATITGHVFCQNSILTSELLYANRYGVYKVLKLQSPWSEVDAGNNGCDPGENNRTYTTTVTRTMLALKGKAVTFKIRFNQTECASSFTTDSSPVFSFPDPPNTNRTIVNGVGDSLSKAEGGIVSLQCEVNGGVPLAMITWNCFGGTVTNTSVDRIARSNITFTATSDQNGQFCTCSATHPAADIIKTSVQIYVTYKPKNVTLQPSSLTYIKHENQQLGPITCSADCNPVCSYTWSGPVSFMVNGPRLHITNIKRNQIGNYKCTASNSLDNETSTNIAVDIFYGPESVSLSPSKTNYAINETNNLGPIQCSADCHPNCSFIWTGLGSFISQGSVLTIDNIQKDKAGIYSCSAKNTAGSASSNVTFVVNYSPKAVNLLPAVLSYILNQSQTLGPIDCSADCHPNCTYTWIGPKPFRHDSYRLYVTNITKQHNGSYNCSATNILGTKLSGNVVVDVNYGPEDLILNSPQSNVFVNETYRLGPIECNATCKPDCNYTWKTPNSNDIVGYKLNIDSIQRSQAGFYYCIASNSIGNRTSKEVNVTVNYAASITGMVISGNNFTVREHSTPTITCDAEGSPLPLITLRYVKNNTIIAQTTGLRLQHTLPYARCEDTGIYRCEADNMFIPQPPVMKDVYVLCSPRPVDTDHMYFWSFQRGKPLNISTVYIAYPQPEFKWHFQDITSFYISEITNGSEHVIINNIFEYQSRTYLHASYMTRPILQNEDFGRYLITAKNEVNVSTNVFTIVAQGKPNHPSEVTVDCFLSANITWTSQYNNGATQRFYIRYVTSGMNRMSPEIKDPGLMEKATMEIHNLKESSSYTFLVIAVNKYGETKSREVFCTTHSKPANIHQEGLIIGSYFGGFITALIIVGVIAYVCIRARKNKNKNSGYVHDGRMQSRYEDMQMRTTENSYDVPATQAEYEYTRRVESDQTQYETLNQSREDTSTYEKVKTKANIYSEEKGVYANTVIT